MLPDEPTKDTALSPQSPISSAAHAHNCAMTAIADTMLTMSSPERAGSTFSGTKRFRDGNLDMDFGSVLKRSHTLATVREHTVSISDEGGGGGGDAGAGAGGSGQLPPQHSSRGIHRSMSEGRTVPSSAASSSRRLPPPPPFAAPRHGQLHKHEPWQHGQLLLQGTDKYGRTIL